MAKRLPDMIENPMVLYREPRQQILGHCSCGCMELITSGYEYIEWDDKVFYDEYHLYRYLEKVDGARRVS